MAGRKGARWVAEHRAEVERHLALVAHADEFEGTSRASQSLRGSHVEHPYFGALRPLESLRRSTVHLAHHRRQVELAAVA